MSRKRCAILGLGEFGTALARELTKLGCEVLAVDRSPKLIDEIKDQVAAAAVADVRDKEALKEIFASRFDVAVVAIGELLEASILATLHLKELPVEEVWAEARSADHAEVLRRVGADRVLTPEAEMGRRVAQLLARRNLVDLMPVAEGYSVIELEAPAWTHGKTLGEIDLRRTRKLSVIAVKSNDRVEVVPGADSSLRAGDRVVVVGRDKDIESFADGK